MQRCRRLGAGLGVVLVAITALTACVASPAGASPGALRIIILESQCASEVPAATLRGQILAEPGVAAVDFVDGAKGTPTAASLNPYDVVVAMGNCTWLDATATGNALADYQDQGGVVVGATFDWQASSVYTLAGRWITGDYSPYAVGAADDFGFATLLPTAPTSPLLAGASGSVAFYRDAVSLTPGATEIAKWSDGASAVATKGRAVGINGYLGDDYLEKTEGNFGRIVTNAGNVLGRHILTLAKVGPGSGAIVSSPAGLECGATCTAPFVNGTIVTLAAQPINGARFAGWTGGGCSGTLSCAVTMTAAQTVSASFEACVVPKLKGKKLKGARKALRRANCSLGKVAPKGVAAGRVEKQHPKPGRVLAIGASVGVKLEAAVEHHGHGKHGH
jgi:hypothetical protein